MDEAGWLTYWKDEYLFPIWVIVPDLTYPAIKTRPMARKPNQGGNVWPSFELASRLYDLANIAFIVSLIVGVFATVLLVWMGNVKEGFLRRDVAQAGAHAADANERAAALEKEAANARLETENLRSQLVPRRLKRDAFVKALVDVPKAAVEIIYARDDFESMEFAQEIAIFLEKGNWQVTSRAPTPLLQKSDEALPSAMAVGGQPAGITIVANAQDMPPYGFKEPDLIHPENDVPTVPFESLQRALLVGVGKLGTHIGGANVPSKGTLRIVVSPKDPVRP